MRFCLLATLALAACASDPSPAAAPDASGPDVATDAAPDVAVIVDALVDAAPDVAHLDAGADVAVAVDAAPEASAPTDAARDASADVDAADPCGAPNLLTCDVNGHNECVNIERGRVLGGVLVHCGACNVMCAAGESCFARTCMRL